VNLGTVRESRWCSLSGTTQHLDLAGPV
jgi:hypothetical protein